MAVRPQPMHDGGIVERRLRPIYDWLDNGNNKKALQEAEKVLKKSPTLQAARALKALALFRLGKGQQAHALLDELSSERLCDDTTLQAMTITYRESQQLHKVCGLYERAVKLDPNNEELHSHLFMSYVRVGDFKSQQRAAMALYKFAPKNPYYFWAVMSIVLQAKTADDSTKRGILLSLAQRMIDNFISDNKMEAEQEARLYIMILELQEKWEDILNFIESGLYSQLVPGPISHACIPYLKKLGHWSRLNLVCKDLLWDNQDRWDYYVPYFDSVFHLMKESDFDCDELVDNTADKCHEFICQLVESMSCGRTLRGPYLARLELYKRLAEDGDSTSLLGSGVALCIEYLRVFAHKPCAVPDLKPYLAMIPLKEREEQSRDFLTCLGFDENSEPDNTDDIQRHISCMAMWRLAATSLGTSENLALANTLRGHYLRSLAKGLVTATPTEFCSADSYAVLAAHHYYYSAMQQQSSKPVVEALSLLELVIHHSPANFHAKLLLLRLYHLIGNALAADTVYQQLQAKHIQVMSLGWLHAARLPAAACATRALHLLADTRGLHAHHVKDCMEHLTFAYKYGTFEKLVELRAWGARLEACAWCAAAGRERALLALLAGPPAPLHAPPPAPPAALRDNRDLSVIMSFEPPEKQDHDVIARTFEQDLAYLRLKDGLVSALALCVECAGRGEAGRLDGAVDGEGKDVRRILYGELITCVDAFSDAMVHCRQMYSAREKISISAPFPSRIIAFVNSPVPYRELYIDSLRMTGELCLRNWDGCQALCTTVTERLHNVPDLLRQGPPTETSEDPVWGLRDQLEELSNFLEFIGIITFLLGVCNEVIATAKAKKPKKKATTLSPDELKTIELLDKLNRTVQDSITILNDIFEKLPEYVHHGTIEEEFAKLSIDKYQNPVEQKLRSGRQDMITDIDNILKTKVKYLKSLIH